MEVDLRPYCVCDFETKMKVALVPVRTVMLTAVHTRYKRKYKNKAVHVMFWTCTRE